MKYSPLLFKAEMVRAIRAGHKTQTRRLKSLDIVNAAPDDYELLTVKEFQGDLHAFFIHKPTGNQILVKTPLGGPGDRIWGKETFHIAKGASIWKDGTILYKADHGIDIGGTYVDCARWKPSIFMPRKASRIILELEAVSVERLQDISEVDAIAEGVSVGPCIKWKGATESLERKTAKALYRELWVSINGSDSWVKNPWVWVYTFKKL